MVTEFVFYFVPTLILINLTLIPFYKNIRNRSGYIYLINNIRWLSFIKWSLLVFCVFGAFGGDWFHYRLEINHLMAYASIPEQNHLEDLYIWLIENITKRNYILYRLVIWTVSILCLSAGFKRLKIDTVTTWCCFIVLSVAVSYAVGRGCLGFSIIIWGYSYLLCPGYHKTFSYLKGGMLLFLSLFCHKSMFLLAPLTLISFINLNTKWIIIIGAIIPFIIGMFRNYILLKLATDDNIAGSAYFTDEKNVFGLGMNLWLYSYYFIIYSFIAYAFHRIIIKKEDIPIQIKRIFNLILLLLFEYIILYFAFTHQGLANDDLAWRVFAMINIPLPIVVSYFFSKGVPKYILYLFNFAFIMADYFIIYNAYTNY